LVDIADPDFHAYSHRMILRARFQIAVLSVSLPVASQTAIAQSIKTIEGRVASPNSSPVRITPAFRTRIKTTADSMSHFATGAILNNRPLWRGDIPPNQLDEQVRLQAALREIGNEPDALRLLIKDPDARIRTVALGALFVREDPQDLKSIAALMMDDTPTVPDLHNSMNAAFGIKALTELESPQTVGSVASEMIRFYLDAAHIDPVGPESDKHGYRRTIRRSSAAELQESFDSYWAERKNRENCASWYLVKLNRATRQTLPFQPQYQRDTNVVLAKIRALPLPDRNWTLYFAVLGGGMPRANMVSDAALLDAGKSIGPRALMNFLLIKPFSSDPDLHFTGSDFDPRNQIYVSISRFILGHVTNLLRPADASALRANATNELQRWNNTTPLWLAAADALKPIHDPARAAANMKAKIEELSSKLTVDNQRQQMALATALWHLRGASETDFLVKWFYTLPSESASRGEFLVHVEEEGRLDTSPFLKLLIAAPNFDTTDWIVIMKIRDMVGGDIETQSSSAGVLNAGSTQAVLASWRNVLRRHFGIPETGFPPHVSR
jgi:hypothetical protein